MKDERFLKTDEQTYELLQLSNFPNFHESGNIEGMRKLFYGEDAFLVQVGDHIYHIDEDTFQAVKDYDFLRQQPVTLRKMNDELAAKQMENLQSLYDKGTHEYIVMELAVKSDLMKKMLEGKIESITTPTAMDEDHILDTADKIVTVLQKFYSLHEADELTRIITDPEKTVEDVKQAMTNIQQRDWEERGLDNLQSKITGATFLLPNDKDVTLWVNIHGLQMPVKTLNETDATDIRNILNGGRSRLTVEDIQDMAKDLALTYYKEELQMSYDQLLNLTAKSDITLTKEDARSYIDLENALKQKFPDGMTLHIPGLDTNDLYSFMMYGKFRDEDFVFAGLEEKFSQSYQYLNVEVRLPKEKVHLLVPAVNEYCDETYEDFINDLDNGEAFEASVTELMHRHPDLKGAKFTIYDHSLYKYLYVSGQPLEKSIAWMMQNPLLETDGLEYLLNDPQAAEQMLDQIRQTPMSEEDRNRTAKMGMPKGLDMIQQSERLYLFERGTLGFAEVDRMRGVRYNGETMSQQAQQYINDFVLNKNIENKHGNTFFLTPGADSERRAYLDTMKNELVMVDIEQSIYGNTMNTKGSKILKEGDMQHFQDITGRITDARIHGIERPLVRCKIDGVQQSGRSLTKNDRIRLGHYMSNTAEMEKFALSMAVKHFATDLYESPEQKRSGGMKR